MTPLYHITSCAQWERARAEGVYRAPSLTTEGFIHLSEHEQVLKTANRWFAGQRGLVLLSIDRGAVAASVRFEEGEPGELFPHLYAELKVPAVLGASPFEPDADGVFRALPTAE